MFLHDGPTTLRRLSQADLSAFLAYRNDPQIAQYQSWDAMDAAEAARFLDHMNSVTPLLRRGRWAQIGVALFSSDILIGDMGLFLSDTGQEAELGITLDAGHQRQGHATRAMRLAAAFVFDQTQVACIRAWADLRNAPSCALMPRAGFTQTGTETTDGIEEAAFVLHRPSGSVPKQDLS